MGVATVGLLAGGRWEELPPFVVLLILEIWSQNRVLRIIKSIGADHAILVEFLRKALGYGVQLFWHILRATHREQLAVPDTDVLRVVLLLSLLLLAGEEALAQSSVRRALVDRDRHCLRL